MTKLLTPQKFTDDFIYVGDTHQGHGINEKYGMRVYHIPSRLTCHCNLHNSRHKNLIAAREAIEAYIKTNK